MGLAPEGEFYYDKVIKPEEEEDDDESDSSEESDSEELMMHGKGNGKREIRMIEHYSSSHRILLVGEGDFSFSLSLAKAFSSARNIVSTSLDAHKDLEKKYNKGTWNVRELEEMGGLVLCGVDATKMSQHFFLSTQRFDRIIYNFPHVEYIERRCLRISKGREEDQETKRMITKSKLNKQLVKGFLTNAKVLLRKEEGEIHVTHKEGDPYNRWDLVKKAEKIGLALHESVPFCKHKYPGYDNKRGCGSHPDDPFPLGDCTTFKFRLAP
ncbi:hypothetical protein HYC85_017577 [Camellia sinensis]|uniref:25S rRNA (uridine-N(3))-methyltransferase BMT5-like domain-containing protein n=1 Tax=Camellia sinensis TaxID=4442 RepID=A0A7J7GS23_CAMSI|nr:hypothetical protein HYC85_017577 [Camellia sinensis]